MTTLFSLSDDEHTALATAIAMGALASRQTTLTVLIELNRAYPSVADGYERELINLRKAALGVLNPTK